MDTDKKNKRIDAQKVDVLVYDFDGVLTDNKVFVFEDGREAVLCSRSDGLAIGMIKKTGLAQVIISTERNSVVLARARKLGIEAIHGVKDKKTVLAAYCRKRQFSLKKVIYIGNDLNDLEAMESAGYPIAPQDAHTRIRTLACCITKAKGGDGVVREVFERVLIFRSK